MSARRTERLLNLVICLLSTRRYLTAQQIREMVPGYGPDDDDAFRRMFERDKEELRDLGIPLEVGSDTRLRGRARLPHRRPRLRAAGHRADRRRGRRGRAGRPALGAGRPGRGRVLGADQAAGRRHRGRPAPAWASSSRTSRPTRPPSSRCSRRCAPAGPSPSTTAPAPPRRSPTAPSSPGASCRGAAAGTSSATTATARPPGCSGSAASSVRYGPVGADHHAAPGRHRPAQLHRPRLPPRAVASDTMATRRRTTRALPTSCGVGRPTSTEAGRRAQRLGRRDHPLRRRRVAGPGRGRPRRRRRRADPARAGQRGRRPGCAWRRRS